MDNFSFVYALLDDGIVFYIGCTKDLVKRYNLHINSSIKGTTKTSKKIKQMMENGKVPEMSIINRLPTSEAFKLEMILIKSMSSAGHRLTNGVNMRDANWRGTKSIPNNITKKEMINIIKERQISCARLYSLNNPYYTKWQTTILEYR